MRRAEAGPATSRTRHESHNDQDQYTASGRLDADGEQHADRVRREARSLFQGQAAARSALGSVDFEQLVHRFLADALNEASARYWRARAEVFEAARPHPEDFTGRADPAELARLDAANREAARACRNRAVMVERGWIDAV